MYKEYEVVELTEDLSETLRKGTRGTILVVYNNPELPVAYEIEFVDELENTIDILTVKEIDSIIRKVIT